MLYRVIVQHLLRLSQVYANPSTQQSDSHVVGLVRQNALLATTSNATHTTTFCCVISKPLYCYAIVVCLSVVNAKSVTSKVQVYTSLVFALRSPKIDSIVRG